MRANDDLGLPGGSGIALIAELNRRCSATVSIVASISDDDQHIFPALRAGAQGYLLKDQRWPQLAELLKGIVEGRPLLSPAIARKLWGYLRPTPPVVPATLTQRETEVLSLIAKAHQGRPAKYEDVGIRSRDDGDLAGCRPGFLTPGRRDDLPQPSARRHVEGGIMKQANYPLCSVG